MPTGRVGASTPRSRLTEGPCSSCSVHSVATLAEPTVPSSSGLGHHPLKVETRVRTPLGLQAKNPRSGPWCCGDGAVEWRFKRRISREYPESGRACHVL